MKCFCEKLQQKSPYFPKLSFGRGKETTADHLLDGLEKYGPSFGLAQCNGGFGWAL
jgi:hypothetical protein